MGSTGDAQKGLEVATGPFSGASGSWTLALFDDDSNEPHNPDLRRDLGGNPVASVLPSAAQVSGCLTEVPYYVAPWRASDHLMPMQGMPAPVVTRPSFSNRLEGWYGSGSIHNRVHLWVAGGKDETNSGSMYWMSSPNDPVFFLHHANIDRLWAQWQRAHPQETYHPSGSGAEIGPPGHNLNDPMQPWGGAVTPSSVLNHHALLYAYDDEPVSIADFVEEVRRAAATAAKPLGGPRPRMRPGPIFGLSEEDLSNKP